MRQRVMIAMALALGPRLLVADEPTTALDVTTQAVILEQIGELIDARGTALLLITHDLSIVAGFAERVIVMYAGFIVESAKVGPLFAQPGHPYTAGLLGSVPQLGRGVPRPIEGTLPDPRVAPRGCPFAPRCPRRIEPCATQMPPLLVHPRDPGGLLACHNPLGVASGDVQGCRCTRWWAHECHRGDGGAAAGRGRGPRGVFRQCSRRPTSRSGRRRRVTTHRPRRGAGCCW